MLHFPNDYAASTQPQHEIELDLCHKYTQKDLTTSMKLLRTDYCIYWLVRKGMVNK